MRQMRTLKTNPNPNPRDVRSEGPNPDDQAVRLNRHARRAVIARLRRTRRREGRAVIRGIRELRTQDRARNDRARREALSREVTDLRCFNARMDRIARESEERALARGAELEAAE